MGNMWMLKRRMFNTTLMVCFKISYRIFFTLKYHAAQHVTVASIYTVCAGTNGEEESVTHRYVLICKCERIFTVCQVTTQPTESLHTLPQHKKSCFDSSGFFFTLSEKTAY